MKKIPLIIFAAAALTVSCTKKANENSVTNTPKVTETPAPENATNQTSAPENATSQTSSPESNTVASNDKPALNPAHGQPYHRCDIAVGAPIDSPAPVQNAAPQMIPQSAPNAGFNTNPITPSPAPSAPSVSSSAAIGPKPALNPPHGEPHHRCDLQVGAPLT